MELFREKQLHMWRANYLLLDEKSCLFLTFTELFIIKEELTITKS